MSQPLLSIGIIFKNDIRSLERCLQALAPLRAAVPCELVMADTGSTDGSREIAEKYADILFDFPWVDDFSAARNAVLDRSSGAWYFTVDSDEYLDRNISELASLLRPGGGVQVDACTVIQRSYDTLEMSGSYTDFPALRLARRSAGLRYERAIHENWAPLEGARIAALAHTVLHHDGYADADETEAMARRSRNMVLLDKELEKDPEDLLTLLQCVESSRSLLGHLAYVRQACAAVEAKKPGWEQLGPPIFRHAVRAAMEKGLPELEEWIARAEDRFPTSVFTRVDVEYIAFVNSWNKRDYVDCTRRGKRYLQAMAELRKGQFDPSEQLCSAVLMSAPYWSRELRIPLASAWIHRGEPLQAVKGLEKLDGSALQASQVERLVQVLCELHAGSDLGGGLVGRFYQQINWPVPNESAARARREAFFRAAAKAFAPDFREREGTCRPSYTLFLPLAGQCGAGTAAAVLEADSREEMEKLLSTVERWDELPIAALEHALLEGVRFPLPGKPLQIEEMDLLAGRMEPGLLAGLAILAAGEDFAASWQSLCWARGLALAAVQSCPWEDEKQGMDLCQAFAKVEGAFLPRYYAQELLCDENLQVLPPMHRFGWHCAGAFEALRTGDAARYARRLREGLGSCPAARAMVEFLLEHTPQLQRPEPSPELLALAGQVRELLLVYPPNDPAVAALKASPAYQKVAWIIEAPRGEL